MANGYYTNSAPPESATKMRSRNESDDRAAVEAAFDKLPAESALKQGIVNSIATDSGSANAYVVSAPYITAYTTCVALLFKAANSNTGASTINVSGLGNKQIRRQDRTQLTSGDIVKNGVYLLAYDGSYFQIVSRSTPTAADAEFATESEALIGESTTKFMSPYLSKLSKPTVYRGELFGTTFDPTPKEGDLLFTGEAIPPYVMNGGNQWNSTYAARIAPAFDGTKNLYATVSLGTSQVGVLSFWMKATQPSTQQYLFQMDGASLSGLDVYIDSDDKLYVRGVNTGNISCLTMDSTVTVVDSAWHHILISWDLSSASKLKLYIDGVSRGTNLTRTSTSISYVGTMYVGSRSGGANKFYGAIQDFVFAQEQYFDFTDIADKRKFIDEAGRPVPWPLDNRVAVQLSGLATQWKLNKGYAGNFTASTLAEEGTSPSE